MKEIYSKEISKAVSDGLYKATHILNAYTLNLLNEAKKNEEKPLAREILTQILDNAALAKKESIPMCQDTGIVTVFVKLGREVHLHGDLYKAINKGVKDAYAKYYLRKSVADPLTRLNTKDNTPAIVHIESVPGDKLSIILAPKGAGSENMSRIKMLNPTDGKDGIKNFVLETIKIADGRPCPPIIVGVGIGGNFEESALMAKKALLKEKHKGSNEITEFESELKEEINKLNIGPMGLGGKTTCLDVYINTCPCHIASLPVAVNIQCHANRHVEVVL